MLCGVLGFDTLLVKLYKRGLFSLLIISALYFIPNIIMNKRLYIAIP